MGAVVTGHPHAYYLNPFLMVILMMCEEIAELYGALLGDGCLSKYLAKSENRIRHCVQLTGHSHDRDYYESVLQPAILKNFVVRGSIRDRKGTNAIIYDIMSKTVFDFFQQLGMPVGKKHELTIPDQILADKNLIWACVRGIFNTDGSIYQRYSKAYKNHAKIYAHQVIQFKMNSGHLLEQLKRIFDDSGIISNRIIRDKVAFVLRITHQESIERFMSLIQTTHSYHRERYLKRRQGNNVMGS